MSDKDSSAEAKLVATPDGTKRWYCNGKLHRDGGPAYEGVDGTKMWFRHGEIHREDGPALIQPDGREEFFLNNKQLEKSEFAAVLARQAQERSDRARAEQERKQRVIDDAHQRSADETHDRLRRTAKTIKPPKVNKP
ncbi:MAG: hypothetical protein ACAH83_16875 [Alphaproteobacteria bacterium]